MAKIKFTKTELKRQRDQLKQFTRFLPTLQLKKQQLQLEIRLCAERIAANERKEKEAVARLAEWTMLFGDADAASVIAAKLRIRKVNREYENIAGVNVPVYHSTDFELEPYDLFSADPWIDDGIEAVKAIVELRIERDIIREQNRLIVQELPDRPGAPRDHAARQPLRKGEDPRGEGKHPPHPDLHLRQRHRRRRAVQDRKEKTSGARSMIIPMKLVTLLCLEQDRSAAVDALAGLELMQLCRTAAPATKDVASLSAQLAECERVIGIVRSAPAMKDPPAAPELADDELVAYASKLISGKTAAFKEQERLQHDLNLLAPWGEFDRSAIAKLQAKGVYVTLCATPRAVFDQRRKDDAFPADAAVSVIQMDKNMVHYALVSEAPLAEGAFDPVALPEQTLSETR